MSITYLFYRVRILSVGLPRRSWYARRLLGIEPKRQSYTSTTEVNNVKR